MTITHSLSTRAMTANLTVGMWQGHRLDKEASRTLTESAGAREDAARVNKHLVDKAALAPIVTAGGALRTHFYSRTLPWKDNGDRILTRKLYTRFIEEHEALVAKFRDEVSKFIDIVYPIEVQRAEFRMGTLFRADDYPSAERLRRRFHATLDIDAVTTSGDFRVDLDQDTLDRVRTEIDTAAEQRVKSAMQDVWGRLITAVSHAQSRLANPDNVFKSSTIENVADIIKTAPGLSLVDDPNLDKVCKELDEIFGSTNVKELRKDNSVRANVAREADEILDKMRGFAGIWGAPDVE